jgi:NAD(P)-dependent dehydrogenase (short-subunit alcohol dehydrogenase family)
MAGHGLLRGRRALVTGAASGIGLAIVRAFVREGARVAVSDLNLGAARSVAAELGSPTRAFRLDVTNGDETARTFRAAAEWLGGLDLVAANAGISTMDAVVDLSEEEWDANMAVNAKGVILTDREAVRHFLATGTKGVIVNTASLAGKIGAAFLAHYAASKFAVVGFTQSLAKEVGPHGIRVNAVCPGYVRTSMQEREIAWEGKLRGMTPEAVRQE